MVKEVEQSVLGLDAENFKQVDQEFNIDDLINGFKDLEINQFINAYNLGNIQEKYNELSQKEYDKLKKSLYDVIQRQQSKFENDIRNQAESQRAQKLQKTQAQLNQIIENKKSAIIKFFSSINFTTSAQ